MLRMFVLPAWEEIIDLSRSLALCVFNERNQTTSERA